MARRDRAQEVFTMSDLATDTAVDGGHGSYTAALSDAWEIWGPQGGYVASVALRAAAAESAFPRPASFSCHYLGTARFGAVDLVVETLRSGRSAQSLRVSMSQEGRPILEATVWTVSDELPGIEHDLAEPPDVPGPHGLPNLEEIFADDDDAGPPFPFWHNFEGRPLDLRKDWPPAEPLEPLWREWLRFVPTETFDDGWIDACRSLILIDVVSWPSAHRHHAWKQPPFIAPSMDLYVAFHAPAPADPWLLADGHSAVAGAGLVGWTGRLWSSERRLVASGMGQLLCRPVSP
jgi:acyl-CoA thioesterase II